MVSLGNRRGGGASLRPGRGGGFLCEDVCHLLVAMVELQACLAAVEAGAMKGEGRKERARDEGLMEGGREREREEKRGGGEGREGESRQMEVNDE